MYGRRISILALRSVLTFSLLIAPFTCAATVISVDIAGGGDFTEIKPAVQASVSGDTILIAPGYYEGEENRGMDLGSKNLVIIGAGPESTTVWCSRQDRAFTVAGGQDSTCVFEGLKLGYGRALLGGGVYCVGSSPVFRNCLFYRCLATWAFEYKGGGVYCESAAPRFEDCTFWYCTVGYEVARFNSWGGGAYAVDSEPTFLRCTFEICRADDGDGSAFCGVNSTSYFEDCGFIRNYGDWYGKGGAVYINGGQATFRGGFFDTNRAYRGGAARCESAVVSFEDIEFRNNYGSVLGGAVSCVGGGPYTFAHCVFNGNRNTYEGGGGLHYEQATGSVDACTFYDNRGELGSAIMAGQWSQFEVTRSIFAFSADGPPIGCEGILTSVTHCCSYGNAGGDSLCGDYHDNIFAHPSFCAPQAGDFTLYSHSPCLPENNVWGELVGARSQGCAYPGPLDAPTGLALAGDDRACAVSWDPIADDFLDHYRVERDTSAAFGEGSAVLTTLQASLTDAPLENGREYYYRVFAVDTLGGVSAPGDTESVVIDPTPPSTPGSLTVAVGDREVELDWLPSPQGDVAQYNVYRSMAPGVDETDLYLSTLLTAVRDTAVANYGSYYYRVASVDTGGLVSVLSGELRGVPHGVPPGVQGFAAFPGMASAVLEWDPASPACQLHYNVYRDTTPGMHTRELLYDGFETYDTGAPPPDPPWSTVQQTDTSVRVSDAAAASGVRSLALADSSGWAHLRTFRGHEDTTAVTNWINLCVRTGDTGAEHGLFQCELIGDEGMGFPVVMLEVFDDSLRHWVSGSDPAALAFCEPGVWHRIECRVDCESDTYGVWLDSVHVAAGAGFFNDARYLDTIQLRTRGAEWGRVWVDDLLWSGLVDALVSVPQTGFTDEPLQEGTTYYYAVSLVDTFGVEGPLSDVISVTPGWVGTDEGEAPRAASLQLRGPNPFSSGSVVAYVVPEPGAPVTVRLYSASGRLVRTLVDVRQEPGDYQVRWDGLGDDGRPAASGVYFCRAAIGEWSGAGKLVLLR